MRLAVVAGWFIVVATGAAAQTASSAIECVIEAKEPRAGGRFITTFALIRTRPGCNRAVFLTVCSCQLPSGCVTESASLSADNPLHRAESDRKAATMLEAHFENRFTRRVCGS
jgi:hypothetical protein